MTLHTAMVEAFAPFASLARPAPLAPRAFKGWHLGSRTEPPVTDITARSCSPRETLAVGTLEAAAAAMALTKDPFVIEETDTLSGLVVIHFYRVTTKREHRFDSDVGYVRRVETFTPVYVGTLAVDAFEPRLPFRAGRDDPLTGRRSHDPAPVIEGVAA